MSTLAFHPGHRDVQPPLLAWWPIALGLMTLYLPTYWTLATGIWNSEEHAHGPIVLVVALYLIWYKRHELAAAAAEKAAPTALQSTSGWLLLIAGLAIYAIGRSQDILIFEIGSQIPVLAAVLLLTLGPASLKALWFGLVFLLFMIPLPNFVVDVTTGPLKQYISAIAEQVLYIFGYPIARNGVVLTIGPYQLLVADACSGLHSMFSLSAMGLLYLYLVRHTSRLRNLLLVTAILPIAFIANVIRVMALILITYHYGDEAAQGFLHGFASISLFVVALLLLFVLDWLLEFVLPDRRRREVLA